MKTKTTKAIESASKTLRVACLVDGKTKRFIAEDYTPVIITADIKESATHGQTYTLTLVPTKDGKCYKVDRPKPRYDKSKKLKAQVDAIFAALDGEKA